MIPDLEDVQEEDMMTQIAAPPRWDVALPTGGGGGKTDIPVIPDSEYVQEEDMVTHIAAPPG